MEAVVLVSNVDREHRFRTEVPPITMPDAFPDRFRSTLSNSISPILVVIQAPVKAELD